MELNSKKFQGRARPYTPLEACAFGARLENRSAFILDSLVIVIRKFLIPWQRGERLFLSIHLQHLPVGFFFAFLRLEKINNSNEKMLYVYA